MPRTFRLSALRLLVVVIAGLCATQSPAEAAPAEAMRLLKSNCFSCHSEQKKKGGLVMTSREALLKGGDNGAALDLAKPDESPLLTSLAEDADPHMPPKKQLSAAHIEVLRQWVRDGAKWDEAAFLAWPPPKRPVTLEALPETYRPVLALALSPDGSRLAVGRGHEVLLYDATAPEPVLLQRRSAHLDPVQCLAWSPDGARLVSGAYRRVTIWDAATLATLREFTGDIVQRVGAVRFLPDGKAVVFADGATVRIATEAIANSWHAHADTILDLAVSSDGKQLATGGSDKLVKVWDVASGKALATLEGHTAQVLAVAFDPKAERLVSGGADQQLKVWDVNTKERVGALGTHSAAISAVTWTPSAIFAATEQGALLRYTDLKAHDGTQRSDAGKERRLESAETTLHAITASTDGERIFAGTHDGRIVAWGKDGKIVARLSEVESAAISTLDSRATPSFLRDVLPVLSKAGCNAGACHAKPDGQNGFHLTVFSYDPRSDYAEIVQQARGRRVFPAAPDESLILLKATESIPHEGGERFAKDSAAYRTLVEWIRGGMIFRGEKEPSLDRITVQPAAQIFAKGAKQPLRVEAHYSDGSTRDVTALADFASNDKEIARVAESGVVSIGKTSGQAVIVARFMGLVADARITVPADRLLPAGRYAALPVRNFIDELAYAHFRQLGLYPSEPCTDAEFLRRATLDTIGALPTPEEARAFLAKPDRAQLIDRLLAHRFYADYWANKWADLLRPNPDRAGIKSVYVLDQWLRASFRENKPYDQFVCEIVTTEGNTHRDGPAVIYRDRREPADLTTMFSQLFLGVRLDCAKCHHHPNEKWGQDDFYRMAAFFGPLKQKGAGISAPISAGNETFYFSPGKTVKHPVTGEVLSPKAPDGPPVTPRDDRDPRRDLAAWMTDPQNPFFARAAANRVWAAFFGRGLVDPVDDFRISNPPTNPALLDALAAELVREKYDLKALMRTILASHLYQLSTTPNDTNKADTRHFSRAYRRRLPAEVLADAIADITGVPNHFPGMPPGSRAMQAWTYKIESQTMDAFGRPNSSSDCPCERDVRPSIVQALHLMNSRQLQEKLASTETTARTQRLAASALPPEEIVRELYLACFSRLPTDDELKLATAPFAAEGATRRRAIEDVLWSLMNSAEFVFNH